MPVTDLRGYFTHKATGVKARFFIGAIGYIIA